MVHCNEAHSAPGTNQQSSPGLILVTTCHVNYIGSVNLISKLHKSHTRTQGHHACQRPIEGHQEAPGLGEEELVYEEDGQAPGGGAQDGVHDGQSHHAAVTGPGDAALGAAIESQKAKDKDEASQSGQRHRVTLNSLDLEIVNFDE